MVGPRNHKPTEPIDFQPKGHEAATSLDFQAEPKLAQATGTAQRCFRLEAAVNNPFAAKAVEIWGSALENMVLFN